MRTTTINEMTLKVSAGVITAVIIGMGSLTITSFRNKVDKQTFEKHCVETERERSRLQNQIDQQVRINTELLKTLNDINLKVERVETNTEWLIKEVKK